MAPLRSVALRIWLLVGGLVALNATPGCGRSRRTDARPAEAGAGGTPDTSPEPSGGVPDAGTGPSTTEPLTSTDLCLAQARLWCARAAACCTDAGTVVEASPCYAERAESCYAADEPTGFNAEGAAECLRDTAAAWSGCFLREDATTALTAAASCARATPPELAALGEPCSGKECKQEPALTVYCDTRSDGVGSFRCEGGGTPAGIYESCGETQRCLEPARCIRGNCQMPLEDGAECSARGQCASGYCCESSSCPEGSSCHPEGAPLVQPEECTRLAGLRNAVRVGSASRNFVAVDGSELYWNEGLELWRSALDGSSASVLVDVPAPQDHPRYYPLAALFDERFVYFLQVDAIGRFERATGNVETVSLPERALDSVSFAATETAFYVADLGCRDLTRISKDFVELVYFPTISADTSAGYLAVGPDSVYCVSNAAVYAMPVEGGAVERLVTLDAWGGPTVFHDGTLYFTNIDHQGTPDGTPSLRSLKVPDGPLEVLAPLDGISRGLVLDAPSEVLYYGEGSSIVGHTLEPGVGVEHTGTEPVTSLAQSETDLYYLAASGVFRLPKPLPRAAPKR